MIKLINSLAYILASSFILLLAYITKEWYEYTYLTYYCFSDDNTRSIEGDIYAGILKFCINIILFTTFIFLVIKSIQFIKARMKRTRL